MKNKKLISIITTMAMMLTMLLPATLTASAATTTTENQNQEDGIVLTKSATPHLEGGVPDGTVDITLEAYTTGSVTSHTTITPTDIVLVLDTSGSMKWDGLGSAFSEFYGTRWRDEGRNYYGMHDAYGTAGGDPITYSVKAENVTGETYGKEYIELTYEGYDNERVSYFSYNDDDGDDTDTEYFYPIMGSSIGDIDYQYNYPKVQFYRSTRMNELHLAASDFIDETLAMNNGLGEGAHKHRIAIVKYADDSYYSPFGAIEDINGAANATIGNRFNYFGHNYTQLVQDFTIVDSTGATSLKDSVNSLEWGGATAVDYGLKMANATFNKRPDAEIDAHNEIVVVFSDGSPTHGSDYSGTVANDAIEQALALKSMGTTVYAISVDGEADSTAINDSTTNTNKFMHFVSSNYPSATGMDYNYATATDAASGYYMTPDVGVDLSKLFEEIVHQVGAPTMSLGTETAVVDTVSQYFDLNYEDLEDPTKDGVTVQTVPKTASGWGTPVDGGATVDFGTQGSKQVLVTGFDFDANYVSETPRDTDFYGKKLRITINVKPNYDAIDKMPTITGVVDTNLAANPAKVVSPNEAEPVATTLSPQVELKKITYWVKGGSYGNEYTTFAGGYYDVYRLPGSEYTVIFNPTEVGHTFSSSAETAGEVPVAITSSKFTMPEDDVKILGVFTPDEYDISYTYAGTVPSNVEPLNPSTLNVDDVPYGTEKTVEAEPTTPEGYTFSGWSADNVTPDEEGKFYMPAGNVEFAGSFKANGNTTFKIVHYLPTLDGTYYDDPDIDYGADPATYPDYDELVDEYPDYGTTDTKAMAIPNQYTGFKFSNTITDGENPDDIAVTYNGETGTYEVSGNIKGNGSLVLKLYYERETYEVEYKYADGTPVDAPTLPAATSYPFGKEVQVANNAEMEHYTFHGWKSETVTATAGEYFTMPAHKVVFNGHFVESGDTPYSVEHWLQELDGTFSLDE